MLSFVFWNLRGNPATATHVSRIVKLHDSDVVLLAECPGDSSSLIGEITRACGVEYRAADPLPTKVAMISKLPSAAVERRFTSIAGELTVWEIAGRQPPSILLAAVHLPAKSGGFDAHAQQTVAEGVASQIAETEEVTRCGNTILVGDFNMNPFDPGMVIITGMHAVMTATLAGKERVFRKRSYRRFYNPMWGLFGDRTPGPPGTYFWNAYAPNNPHWHMLDQLLLRPSLIKKLVGLQILETDGTVPLLAGDRPNANQISDHLPIVFQLDV